jgi:hypothetical protein
MHFVGLRFIIVSQRTVQESIKFEKYLTSKKLVLIAKYH